jgi:ADP-ribosylglycohydrolase
MKNIISAAVLWCYFHSKCFEDGLLAVVNEGGDADTNSAVACAVLGAKFVFNAIPKKYVDGLRRKNDMEKVVTSLIDVLNK